ncbi:MAG: hypothetical protein AAF215_35745 [Cyanobacteria bacterium P01_A01_bin.123]
MAIADNHGINTIFRHSVDAIAFEGRSLTIATEAVTGAIAL